MTLGSPWHKQPNGALCEPFTGKRPKGGAQGAWSSDLRPPSLVRGSMHEEKVIAGLALINTQRPQDPPPIPPKTWHLGTKVVGIFHKSAFLHNIYVAFGGSLQRSAHAVQLFGHLAVLETHTLRY